MSGGIDRSSGHIGVSSSSQFANTASQVGGAAFNVALSGASMAAGAFGGQGAAGLVQSAGSMLRSGVSSTANTSGGALAGQVQGEIKELNGVLNTTNTEGAISQKEMLELQRSINTESQLFNTITNTQKSKHDAAMAAIQNTR